MLHSTPGSSSSDMVDGGMAALLRDHARQERHAHAGADEFDHEIDLAAEGADRRLKAGAPASVEDDAMQAEAGLEHDEGRVFQLPQRDRGSRRKRVIARDERDHRLSPHRGAVEIRRHGQQQAGEFDLAGA